jgi:glycolate oxidase FAD binding subunit
VAPAVGNAIFQATGLRLRLAAKRDPQILSPPPVRACKTSGMSTPDACLIDAVEVPVERPASVADLGDLVRRAAASGQAVFPLGGRTSLAVGLPPARPGIGVDLRGLCQVVDYPARDMTVTVQAGITLAELQRLLAGESQRLPIDVPRPGRATLGGALAVNASGPRRHGCGTLRDYVLGISTVNDQGQETRAGGRVVKNVAGYDLCKLHIGALGTLGVISQVTLKVLPAPEARVLATLGCQADDPGPLLDLLYRSRTRPVCLDLLNQAAARSVDAAGGGGLPATPWVVVVGFEGGEESVNGQVTQLIREVASARVAVLEARAGPVADPLWRALAETALDAAVRLTFKANLRPGDVAAFCRRAAALPEQPALQAHAGAGIVRGHVAALTLERAAAMLTALLDAATAQGNVVVPHCPPDWKAALPVWGRPRGDWALMRQVKDALDPRRLFNPGRFVDGL